MPDGSTETFGLAGKRVFVAGHRGLVGSALMRRLARENCTLLTAGREMLDLRRQADVESWMAEHKPDAVFLAAATVGGILANSSYPADFLYDNLMIEANVIDAAYRAGVAKLLFLASSCVYPASAEQPISEDALLTGPLDESKIWYGVAKIAGIKLTQAYRRQHGCDFISCMPTNLYGPGDNFDLQSSHVLPALVRKIHEAKVAGAESVEMWGSGGARREFLHVDDLADACVFLMTHYSEEEQINLGSGDDVTILELVEIIKEAVGFEGAVTRDLTKPDGAWRKLMAADKLRALGWQPRIGLREGIADTYRWFVEQQVAA